MWLTRYRYPMFSEVLDASIIRLFVLWLLGCVVATWLERLGCRQSGALSSGLLFGSAVAGAFVVPFRPRLALSGSKTLW